VGRRTKFYACSPRYAERPAGKSEVPMEGPARLNKYTFADFKGDAA